MEAIVVKIKIFLNTFLRDLTFITGALTLITAIWLLLVPTLNISAATIWRILLGAASLAGLKQAFFKSEILSELSAKAQLAHYAVTSTLGGLSLTLLLCYFTPGGASLGSWVIGLSIILPLFLTKAIATSMMYWDAKSDAQAINEKLKSKIDEKS